MENRKQNTVVGRRERRDENREHNIVVKEQRTGNRTPLGRNTEQGKEYLVE